MAKVTREQEAEYLARASVVGPTLGETLEKIAARTDVTVRSVSLPGGERGVLPEATVAVTERPDVGKDARKGSKARGRHVQGQKNKLEQAYEDTVLAPRLARGEIIGFWFEPLKLRIGKACYYTPDFLVMLADCTLELHEVKAMWRRKGGGERAGWQEDSRIKAKAAAERYTMLAFVAVAGSKRKGEGWKWKEERL